jgi:hypothetical protein
LSTSSTMEPLSVVRLSAGLWTQEKQSLRIQQQNICQQFQKPTYLQALQEHTAKPHNSTHLHYHIKHWTANKSLGVLTVHVNYSS